jgi:hypothetical protein
MTGQITPQQIENLLTLNAFILELVALRLIGLAIWRKWFANATTDDELTQEERDLRLVTRRARR